MTLGNVAVAALLLSLAACGGVRERIRAEGAPPPARFDARELVDVLPPGRIAAVVRPSFEPGALAADWLKPAEPVIVVTSGEDARAYPLAILVWHEVVNDTVGGVPVAVTYAPLSNAAVVFDRRAGGRTESFRVSGKLYRSNLVMADRRTTTLWTQLDGRAVAGPLKGASLTVVPSQIASLAEFQRVFPGGSVLARPEGSGRAYGFNPYAGYDARTAPFGGFFAREPDRRVRAMERVVGVGSGAGAMAFRFRDLLERRVTTGRLDGRQIVVWWEPGARSALDTADISEGRAVGSAGVFYAPTDGSGSVGFEPATTGFRDRRTRSTWSVLGVATAGPSKGQRLQPVAHVDAFWFAWAAFHPETNA